MEQAPKEGEWSEDKAPASNVYPTLSQKVAPLTTSVLLLHLQQWSEIIYNVEKHISNISTANKVDSRNTYNKIILLTI